MNTPDILDAVIVGGNVVGLLTALELLHRGLRVRIIDKDFHGPVRTHVGELSLLGGDPDMDALFQFGLSCWKDAGTRYGVDMGLVERGVLDLGTSKGRTAMLMKETETEKTAGILSDMLNGGEAIGMNLGAPVGSGVSAAKWWAEGPVISTHTVLETLRQQLATKGALIWGQDEVKELVTDGDKVTGVRVANGEVALAKYTIIAAGAVAGKMLKSAHVNLPLRPARTHLMTLVPPAEGIGFPLVVHRLRRGHLWLKRTREGPVLVAYDGLMDPTQATYSAQPDINLVNALRQHVGDLIPSLMTAELQQLSVNTAAVTPDFKPAIGSWRGMDGLLIATGFAGRIYAFAAAAARIMGSLVAGEEPPIKMDAFYPQRFVSGQWQQVAHPPSLAWAENIQMAESVLVDKRVKADFADNVQMVGKEITTINKNVQMVEKKIITSASASRKPKEAESDSKGYFGNSKVKAAGVKLSI